MLPSSVVVEAIEHHIERGEPPRDAAIHAMDLRKIRSSICENSEEAAKTKILLELESFLKHIKKIDTEENPRAVEHKFYKKLKKCRR